MDLCVSSYIFVFCLVFFILYFCIFVLGGLSSTPNEDIVRFRCGKESYTLFAQIIMKFFVKIFQFLCSFLSFGVVYAFLIGF